MKKLFWRATEKKKKTLNSHVTFKVLRVILCNFKTWKQIRVFWHYQDAIQVDQILHKLGCGKSSKNVALFVITKL